MELGTLATYRRSFQRRNYGIMELRTLHVTSPKAEVFPAPMLGNSGEAAVIADRGRLHPR
jgi:hypothetical protein